MTTVPRGAGGTHRAVTGLLMDLLDELVQRHRAVVLLSEHVDVHADLIAAEVSHQLAGAPRGPAPGPTGR